MPFLVRCAACYHLNNRSAAYFQFLFCGQCGAKLPEFGKANQTVGNAWCRSCKKEMRDTNRILTLGNCILCCDCVQIYRPALKKIEIAGFAEKGDIGCKGCEKYHYWIGAADMKKFDEVIAL